MTNGRLRFRLLFFRLLPINHQRRTPIRNQLSFFVKSLILQQIDLDDHTLISHVHVAFWVMRPERLGVPVPANLFFSFGQATA